MRRGGTAVKNLAEEARDWGIFGRAAPATRAGESDHKAQLVARDLLY